MNLINLIFSILFSPCNWTKENNFYVFSLSVTLLPGKPYLQELKLDRRRARGNGCALWGVLFPLLMGKKYVCFIAAAGLVIKTRCFFFFFFKQECHEFASHTIF